MIIRGRLECLEVVQVGHGEDGTRLRKVDDSFTQAAPLANHLPGHPDLAGEVLGASKADSQDLEREPVAVIGLDDSGAQTSTL